jgi:hypothetical protein
VRAGSTGLGKTELSFNLFTAEQQEREIVLRGKTYDPVIWDIRVILTPSDIPVMLNLLSEDATITVIRRWLKELDQKDLSSYLSALQKVLTKLPDILDIVRDKDVLIKTFEALAGLNREQVINLFDAIKKLLAAEDEFDTFLRASSLLLRGRTALAVLLLDENRRDLMSGLLVRIRERVFPSIPEGIDRIEKIDLNLEVNGKKLSEVFKQKAMLNAIKDASQVIQGKYGGPLLMVIFDVKTLNEVFDALSIRIGKLNGELFDEVIRLVVEKVLKGDIIVEPVPHLIHTIQKTSLVI